MKKYVIGIDYGSLSARGILADVENGSIIKESVCEYRHGIMDSALPDGTELQQGWVLQHPQDYAEALETVLTELACSVDSEQVIGIGLDCTATTALPVTEDGTPLCFLDEYRSNPYAYMMMWKHHAASAYAERMTQVARQRGEKFLTLHGNAVNSERLFPRLLQVYEEAPNVYQNTAYFVEALDWLTWQMTGCLVRSACALGYKAFYLDDALPSAGFLEALSTGFSAVCNKLDGPVLQPAQSAGLLTPEAAQRFHLRAGIPIAVGMIDAHAGVPAAGVSKDGVLLSIVGTSTCHIVSNQKAVPVPGISGAVANGVLPGSYWYEAGQSSVGDCFAWFSNHFVSETYQNEARERQIPIQSLLTEKAARMKPEDCHVLALDWWNGNRSILNNANLSGALIGLTLKTKAEEVYHALIEGTAFGMKEIVLAFGEKSVPIREIRVSGGIALKNQMAMQIYADVLNMPLTVMATTQGPALGSAIYAAVASGYYQTMQQAIDAMQSPVAKIYMPCAERVAVYEKRFAIYHQLHQYFGVENPELMKDLLGNDE